MKPSKKRSYGSRNRLVLFTDSGPENGRIASRLPTVTTPLERPAPMQHWQLDAHSTPPASDRTRIAKNSRWWQHGSIIDKGTSVLVSHHVRSDFTAETASFGCGTNGDATRVTAL